MIIKMPVSNPFEMGLCAKCKNCLAKRYTRSNEVVCVHGSMFGWCNQWDLRDEGRVLFIDEKKRVRVAVTDDEKVRVC